MWCIYNIVQLQPVLCRNFASNGSSHSRPPIIIEPTTNSTQSKKSFGSLKENSNKSRKARISYEQQQQQLISLRNSEMYMKNQMLGKQTAFYGGSTRLINRFRNLFLDRFYDSNKSSPCNRLFAVVDKTKDNTGTEKNLITKVKISTYTNSLLRPDGIYKLDSKHTFSKAKPTASCSQRSHLTGSGYCNIFTKENIFASCKRSIIQFNENDSLISKQNQKLCSVLPTSTSANKMRNSGSEYSSLAVKYCKHEDCQDKVKPFQFVDKNVAELWRGQPPSQRLEEILEDLRQWEKEVGWHAPNSDCGRNISSEKIEISKMTRYANEMQKKNNIRNQKRFMGFDHTEEPMGLGNVPINSSISEKVAGSALLEAPTDGQLINALNLSNSMQTSKSTAVLKYYNAATNPIDKSDHDRELKINDGCSNNLNKCATVLEAKQKHDDRQQSDIYLMKSEVKEIDSIIKNCENLKRLYKMRLKRKFLLRQFQQTHKSKNNKEMKNAQSNLLKTCLNAMNNRSKSTKQEDSVNKRPKYVISVMKLKNLNKFKSSETVEKENGKERKIQTELKKINAEEFEKLLLTSGGKLSPIDGKLKKPEGKQVMDLTKKCWEAVLKTRNSEEFFK